VGASEGRWPRGRARPRGGAAEPRLEGKPSQGFHFNIWQRALWRAVFGPDGRLARQASANGIRYLPLDALWDEAMAKKPAPFAGKTVHVFGLSYIATAYHRMLAALARASTVHIYTLNPCREDRGRASGQADPCPDDPFGLGREAQPALAPLGAAGPGEPAPARRLPRRHGGCAFPRERARGATLLRRLQNDIVNRRAPDKRRTRASADGSLRVLPCPSLRRELEVVAAEIWNLARRDPSLRLCDVAVIVPEASKELYLAQLSAVFGESCDLPHSVADLSAASAHRVAEAIELLLHLPFSTFTRKDFLPLVTHPCLMARFPKATPESWRELAHALGIVRGADRGDLAGSYVTRDLFTWDQGLRRWPWARSATARSPTSRALVIVAGESYLPGPPLDSADEECLGFGLLVRSLIADARFASGGDKTPERPLASGSTSSAAWSSPISCSTRTTARAGAVVAQFLAELEGLSDTASATAGFLSRGGRAGQARAVGHAVPAAATT
jgi:exodeoxyribonuclease V gamma subunit